MDKATPVSHRPATPGDAGCLVDIAEMAGGGLAEISWADFAEPGESLREVGLRRARRDEGGFSWRNATLFEIGGLVVGGLIGFPAPAAPVPAHDDMPPVYRPFHELENLACGSWYINMLGVYPDARSRGVGGIMLAHAETVAREGGFSGTSVIVASVNEGAERLYRRSGYAEIGRRTVALQGWRHDGCEAILLAKGR